jgi:hypothetical protein
MDDRGRGEGVGRAIAPPSTFKKNKKFKVKEKKNYKVFLLISP